MDREPFQATSRTSQPHRERKNSNNDATVSKNTGFLRKTVAENYGRRSQIAKNLGKSAIFAC